MTNPNRLSDSVVLGSFLGVVEAANSGRLNRENPDIQNLRGTLAARLEAQMARTGHDGSKLADVVLDFLDGGVRVKRTPNGVGLLDPVWGDRMLDKAPLLPLPLPSQPVGSGWGEIGWPRLVSLEVTQRRAWENINMAVAAMDMPVAKRRGLAQQQPQLGLRRQMYYRLKRIFGAADPESLLPIQMMEQERRDASAARNLFWGWEDGKLHTHNYIIRAKWK